MMLGKEYDDCIDLGDIEALQGVCKFPARIKCATLAWKALEKGINEDKNVKVNNDYIRRDNNDG